MTSTWLWKLQQIGRRLWVRAVLFSVLGVATAFVSLLVSPVIPPEVSASIGAEAVDDILKIIASSMLAVTIFTLSIMVQAFGASSSSATPRASQLLIEDSTAQNVLSTFLGSFLFALVGIVALRTGVYGDTGRVVLFTVTIGMIALIVAQLIRWFDHLTMFGRLADTAERVESATCKALVDRRLRPYLGCRPLTSPSVDVPPAACRLRADKVGYVRHIDCSALQSAAKRASAQVYILALPGAFVDPATDVLAVAGEMAPEADEELLSSLTIGKERSYDQDPRFGLSVLAEIAARALSPGVNDPGTAIDVIGRQQRLMFVWMEERQDDVEIVFDALYAPPLRADDLMEDAFAAIGRDGAGTVEVALRLQKAFRSIAIAGRPDMHAAAYRQSLIARERAGDALKLAVEKARIEALAIGPPKDSLAEGGEDGEGSREEAREAAGG
ncbi:MAG: DUF2254 domain-containing protein [Hyphomicrobiaceae bacterium]